MTAIDRFSGKRVLLVEDNYLILLDLMHSLEKTGAVIIGPAADVRAALELIETAGDIDAAVLDVNLHDAKVYPVADALRSRGVPFVFATGYDSTAISSAYADVVRCEKPVSASDLAKALFGSLEGAGTASPRCRSST